MALKEDYKDATFSGLRKYKNVDNGDGTVSMVDVTEYAEAGDKFGAKDVNAMTKMINNTGDDFNEGQDYVAGDYAVHDNKVWKFTSPHPAGPWDESHVKVTTIAKELAELSEKVIYRSSAPFALNQTVRISDMANYDDNTMFVITAFRYAWGGSVCLPKSEIIKSNFNSGFFISFQEPSLYWLFTINANFDLTLIKNTSTSDRTPYVSITKI